MSRSAASIQSTNFARTLMAATSSSVYVQTNWPAGQSYEEAKWVQSVIDTTGWPHANVAHADLAAGELLARLAKLEKDGAALARAFPETTFVLEHAGMLENASEDGWK